MTDRWGHEARRIVSAFSGIAQRERLKVQTKAIQFLVSRHHAGEHAVKTAGCAYCQPNYEQAFQEAS